jgi:hypothetical protein
MTISQAMDHTGTAALDAPATSQPTGLIGSVNLADFRMASAAPAGGTADKHLGNVSIVDDQKCEQPKGFWGRLEDSVNKAMTAEAGLVPPEDPPVCKAETPAHPAVPAPADQTRQTHPATGPTPEPLFEAPPPGSKGPLSKPEVRLGNLNGATQGPGTSEFSDGKGGLVVHLGQLPLPGQGDVLNHKEQPAPVVPGQGDGQTHKDQPAPAVPGQDKLNPLLGGVLDNIGKPVTDLEHGINPRLGCVRMVSHAMHEADPSFPETNNTAEFRKALKAHGYEEVTVQPGDPALKQSHAGDVLVGQRPDGMPSHAAINMGDGTVFNNNSDSGKGQIDSLDQFNQGMHDKNGHWMKNGFNSVTIYRKVGAPASAAHSDTTTTGSATMDIMAA